MYTRNVLRLLKNCQCLIIWLVVTINYCLLLIRMLTFTAGLTWAPILATDPHLLSMLCVAYVICQVPMKYNAQQTTHGRLIIWETQRSTSQCNIGLSKTIDVCHCT